MFKSFGPFELIIVLLIVLLIFGGAKLPTLGRSLGQSISEFRKGIKTGESEEKKAATNEMAVAPPQGKNNTTPNQDPQH
ncbi:MAG: twin-arginine translocase TatA/TatE family subunit [Chloroflexi bacterium]|nr:twin-arginine translocase TatA/TatE family subunit [Chloroflexota bacterium]